MKRSLPFLDAGFGHGVKPNMLSRTQIWPPHPVKQSKPERFYKLFTAKRSGGTPTKCPGTNRLMLRAIRVL